MKLLHTCLAVLLMALCTGPVAVAQTTTMDYSYYDGTNISITHTDKYVAVILNDNEDVGIDIESLSRDFSGWRWRACSTESL